MDGANGHSALVTLKSPLGCIAIAADGDQVVRVELDTACQPDRGEGKALTLARRARRELMGYLAGHRQRFTVPLRQDGTAFQRAVWRALTDIPYGETVSYGDLARRLGKPGAGRAIGTACNRNPLPLIVPCHRVVAADGLGGFGYGPDVKRWLLDLEHGDRLPDTLR